MGFAFDSFHVSVLIFHKFSHRSFLYGLGTFSVCYSEPCQVYKLLGYLMKRGKNVLKEYVPRYCVINNDCLYYYKTPQVATTPQTPKLVGDVALAFVDR